jgi:hypothetical protein
MNWPLILDSLVELLLDRYSVFEVHSGASRTDQMCEQSSEECRNPVSRVSFTFFLMRRRPATKKTSWAFSL